MDELTLARALHVLAIVIWIGGVAMVTTVLLPAVRRLKSPNERLAFFEEVEGRFAGQARVTTLIAGLTGLYMVHRLDAWDRFLQASYWWMHAMVLVWALFTFMLFIAEPLFLHRLLRKRFARDPEGTFSRIQYLHWGMLMLSLITIFGAVAGSHGFSLF
jgi:uncharacterized membrane protein